MECSNKFEKLENLAIELKDIALCCSRSSIFDKTYNNIYSKKNFEFFKEMERIRVMEGYIVRLSGHWVEGIYTNNKYRVYDIVEYIPF